MPYRKNWTPFDDSLKDDIGWGLAKMRLNKKPRKAERVPTGMISVDDVLGGGLAEGLTIVYGPAGSGKSLFAKTIAKKFLAEKKKVLYFFGEDSFDSLEPKPPLMNNVDMVAYRPGPPKAVKTILKYIKEMKPDLVVLDSLTTILGGTNKAVMEADVREWTGILAARISGVVPVIGISEVRGNGQYMGPAGGQGVAHAGLSMLFFNKVAIKSKWDAQDYNAEFGSVVYTFMVEKDRDGVAKQGHFFRVLYVGDDIYMEEV